ncbi:myelin basic protein isoform X2 [Malaclemys terrapin pileata]|uniref:Myelin basic protein n=2 Tax=Emydidae TaxID=8476 RepID=A0A8C3F7K9_CHRPI|nr:myelin basic protein isoform X2 [Chrysemys picta bellii]XP_053877190.1 myelin basic protein isoform X2 [Malaclemys terrapin pileata]
MGNHVGKRDQSAEKPIKDSVIISTEAGPSTPRPSLETKVEEVEEAENKASPKAARLTKQPSEDNEVFGEADVNQNNGTSTKSTAVTDSKGTADSKNAWKEANPADTVGRPHLIRLFSRDAPGREDNTFKDRPSESDELQTIQEDSAATSENSDLMASQKRSSFRHGSKMATASTIDHARHGSPRHRDSGLLDSLGRFFGGEKQVPRRGSGKDIHAARASHVGSMPQRSQHGRPGDDNPVVHFFKNIVSPRTPPPEQAKGGEGHKPGYGGSGKFYEHKSAYKGHKGSYHDGQGTLSKIFKLGGSGSRPGSRSGSPVARR